MGYLSTREPRTGLASVLLAWLAGAVMPAPARAIFASPIQAGCYVVAPGRCRFHVEPFTIQLASGTKLVSFRVVAIAQGTGTQTAIYAFAPDQSNPVPLTGSTFAPSLVTQDFSATCGKSYTVSLQGQDTGDAGPFNLGLTGVIDCPSGAGGLVWIPIATTGAATAVTASAATLNGTVDPQGGDTTVQLEYGPTTAYGSIATPAPSVFTGVGAFDLSAAVSGLTPNAAYHFRLVATNSAGTARGADQLFATPDRAKRFVGGRKLALKGSATPAKRRGTIILSAPDLNAGLDPRHGGIELHLVGAQPASSDVWTMPAAGWRSTKKGAKYADQAHANGPVTAAVIRGKLLVVRAKGAGIGFTLPAVGAHEAVAVAAVFPGADTALCAEFQAKNKKGLLIGAQAPPPTACNGL